MCVDEAVVERSFPSGNPESWLKMAGGDGKMVVPLHNRLRRGICRWPVRHCQTAGAVHAGVVTSLVWRSATNNSGRKAVGGLSLKVTPKVQSGNGRILFGYGRTRRQQGTKNCM